MDNGNDNNFDILMDKLSHVEKDIFEYSTGNINNDVVNMFSFVIENGLIGSSDTQGLASLNQIMSECLTAMQNSDYLLLADLLRYRLMTVLGGAPKA